MSEFVASRTLQVDAERKFSCIHTLISDQVRRSPDSPAICLASNNTTYRQLENFSNVLSQYLRKKGVGVGDIVPFCFEKSTEAIIAMLAVLKTGGVCVPLDPTQPSRRIRSILEASGAKVVITSPINIKLFEGMGIDIFVVTAELLEDLESETILLESSDFEDPDAPAFIMFTSGSSGKPKGVVLQHAAICTSAHYHGAAMRVDATTRTFQFAAYTFDMSLYDIFTTLIYGGCVCVPSDQDRYHNITGAMREMEVNWAFLTPSILSILDPSEIPALKILQIGAEPASSALVETWAEKVCLINGYGSTECSTCIIGILSRTHEPRYIGFPHGVSAWVTDPLDHNRVVRFGEIGELVVSGPVLAQGYFNDEELTRERFLTKTDWLPLEHIEKGIKAYKTGDLVLQGQDGSFRLVGRQEAMVKIRGQRVELAEVESHLSENEHIKLCAVALPKEGIFRDCLTAIYEPKYCSQPSEKVTDEEMIQIIGQSELMDAELHSRGLANFLRDRLPSYMIPQHWVAVRTMPLLSHGKRNRLKINSWLATLRDDKSIGNPAKDQAYQGSEHEVGDTHMIQKIAALLRELTQGAFPHAEDDNMVPLLEAGLDSIKQIAFNRKLKAVFGVSVDVSLLSISSPLEISRLISNGLTGKSVEVKVPIVNPLEEYNQLRLDLQKTFSTSPRNASRIFLTGASGFLGIYILKQLLTTESDTVIVCLTRSQNQEEGMQRLSKAARIAKWSLHSYHHRIRVWAGDLRLPKLGLTITQWNCLTGDAPREECIDAVIHNGAAVHWTKDYRSLKSVNVLSTMSILQAIGHSPMKPSLVYVSGGRAWRSTEGSEFYSLEDTQSLGGYDLSKILAELLVKEFTRLSKAHSVSIVRPGYIIGAAENGIAYTDDFIWRLVATNISLKSYNGDEVESWLYISGVDRIAEAVVSQLLDPGEAGIYTLINVTDGLTIQEFWNIFTDELGFEMDAVSASAWLDNVQASVDFSGETHPLWPLLDVLMKNNGQTGVQRAEKVLPRLISKYVRATILRNVEFLGQVGFLPSYQGEQHRMTDIEVFTRNTT